MFGTIYCGGKQRHAQLQIQNTVWAARLPQDQNKQNKTKHWHSKNFSLLIHCGQKMHYCYKPFSAKSKSWAWVLLSRRQQCWCTPKHSFFCVRRLVLSCFLLQLRSTYMDVGYLNLTLEFSSVLIALKKSEHFNGKRNSFTLAFSTAQPGKIVQKTSAVVLSIPG